MVSASTSPSIKIVTPWYTTYKNAWNPIELLLKQRYHLGHGSFQSYCKHRKHTIAFFYFSYDQKNVFWNRQTVLHALRNSTSNETVIQASCKQVGEYLQRRPKLSDSWSTTILFIYRTIGKFNLSKFENCFQSISKRNETLLSNIKDPRIRSFDTLSSLHYRCVQWLYKQYFAAILIMWIMF